MGAVELLIALGVAAAVVRLARRGAFVFVAVATGAWIAIDLALGQFPVGSFGLETLLTAVLVRGTASEPVAGLASRTIVVGLLAGSFVALRALARLARRLGRRLLPASAVLVLFSIGCSEAEPTKSSFEPRTPGDSSEILRLSFEDPARLRAAHPVVPAGARTNATCLACHAQVVARTALPLARKGVHEIHATIARVEHECVSCHESAGRPGFPGDRPGEHARRESNQKCAGCHSAGGAPFWKRAAR